MIQKYIQKHYLKLQCDVKYKITQISVKQDMTNINVI